MLSSLERLLFRPNLLAVFWFLCAPVAFYRLTFVYGYEWGVIPWWVWFAGMLLTGIYLYWYLVTERPPSEIDRRIMYVVAYFFVGVMIAGIFGG